MVCFSREASIAESKKKKKDKRQQLARMKEQLCGETSSLGERKSQRMLFLHH